MARYIDADSCACDCKESADRLARSVGGFVVSSKEVKQ